MQAIQTIYDDNHQIYGAPKIAKEMQKKGEKISQRTVGVYMREMGIKACYIKPYVKTTFDSDFSTKLHNILKSEYSVLLSRKAPDAEIKVRLDMSELDITSAESKATYKEIQEYVQNKYDLHVTNLYIAQVKREFGIIERENYNTGEGKARVPQVTPEKREAIIEALRYFQMIE